MVRVGMILILCILWWLVLMCIRRWLCCLRMKCVMVRMCNCVYL